MQPVKTMPAITIARERIETDTPQSADELMPFEAEIVQALNELTGMFS